MHAELRLGGGCSERERERGGGSPGVELKTGNGARQEKVVCVFTLVSRHILSSPKTPGEFPDRVCVFPLLSSLTGRVTHT